MQSRKQQLVDATLRYLLRHGLADLSLRPLAAATNTSARLLIYHFGSKEGLLAEVLDAMQSYLQASFAELAAGPRKRRKEPLLKVFWRWATAEEQSAHLKLLYELQILAARNPREYARYLKRNSMNWLELVKQALPPSERTPAMATLLVAVFDGLFIEFMSTDNRQRTAQALNQFIRLVQRARVSGANED
jgi:AcrR family transcriptional regulator